MKSAGVKELRMRRLVMLAFAICGPATALANEAHDRLSKLGDAERNAKLAQLLTASGEKCTKVTKKFYQGSTPAGDAFWNAACSNGKDYAIMVKNDKNGSTKILECSVLKVVTKSDCFTRFK